jgi:hypothetical protein
MLEVACSRCERRGRLNVARLIERHGAAARLPDLRGILAADCPRSSAVSIHERCGVHYPQLVATGPAQQENRGGTFGIR